MYKSYSEFFEESVENYGCVMLNGDLSNPDIHNILDKSDVKEYEDLPHITILYGLHTDINHDDVVKFIHNYKFKPTKIIIDQIDIFTNAGCDDVVKLTVDNCDYLIQLHKDLMSRFANTQSYDKYNPHITLAYVIEGAGRDYVQKLNEPIVFNPTCITYSYNDGEQDKEIFILTKE